MQMNQILSKGQESRGTIRITEKDIENFNKEFKIRPKGLFKKGEE